MFVATEPDFGTELWSSDGADASRVADINAGTASSNPTSLINVNGTLFFAAYQPATGIELWKSDGTNGGTSRAVDIRRGFLAQPLVN